MCLQNILKTYVLLWSSHGQDQTPAEPYPDHVSELTSQLPIGVLELGGCMVARCQIIRPYRRTLQRSNTQRRTQKGGHIAERCRTYHVRNLWFLRVIEDRRAAIREVEQAICHIECLQHCQEHYDTLVGQTTTSASVSMVCTCGCISFGSWSISTSIQLSAVSTGPSAVSASLDLFCFSLDNSASSRSRLISLVQIGTMIVFLFGSHFLIGLGDEQLRRRYTHTDRWETYHMNYTRILPSRKRSVSKGHYRQATATLRRGHTYLQFEAPIRTRFKLGIIQSARPDL